MTLRCAGLVRRGILFQLLQAELFSNFLHDNFPASKRFGIGALLGRRAKVVTSVCVCVYVCV